MFSKYDYKRAAAQIRQYRAEYKKTLANDKMTAYIVIFEGSPDFDVERFKAACLKEPCPACGGTGWACGIDPEV